jgi:UDP-N-acetylmuramyl pentapeptide synthase
VKFLASQVAAAVDGELFGDDILLDGATQDSRSVTQGCLFVPLLAERDGHEFMVRPWMPVQPPSSPPKGQMSAVQQVFVSLTPLQL